jgi:hypothetical protein
MQDQIEPRLLAMIAQAPSLAAKLDHGRNKKTLKYINGVPVRLAHSFAQTGEENRTPAGGSAARLPGLARCRFSPSDIRK